MMNCTCVCPRQVLSLHTHLFPVFLCPCHTPMVLNWMLMPRSVARQFTDRQVTTCR